MFCLQSSGGTDVAERVGHDERVAGKGLFSPERSGARTWHNGSATTIRIAGKGLSYTELSEENGHTIS